jgi:phenylalanyl-tRNA synthetase beta chain
LIDLSDHPGEKLRHLLDDVGLEVKSVETVDGDSVYNIETLANRGDHASHHGVATELAGRLLRPVRFPDLAELPDVAAGVPVRITTPLCPRYSLLEIPDVSSGALDVRLARLLRRLGSDLYGKAADVTNLVSFELGQPMHAFDRAKVAGEVRVEELSRDTEVVALDGQTYLVPRGSLAICDAQKVIAIAGVIGCKNSCVDDTTRSVLLESALFDPVRVRITARAIKLSTRASFRFERGGDVSMVPLGQRRALRLLHASASGFTDLWPDPPGPRLVGLRLPHLATYLACELGRDEVVARLSHLGYRLASEQDGTLAFEVPPHRLWDVEAEPDLIEDVARSYGYDRLPEVMPSIVPAGPTRTAHDELDERVRGVLVASGFFEVIAPSLHGPELTRDLPIGAEESLARFVTTTNSRDSAFSTLRNNNLTLLCRILRENADRGVTELKVFERGVVFEPDPGSETGVRERWIVSAAAAGRWAPGGWRDKREVDFALMKGVVENIGHEVGVSFGFVASKHPLLRPHARADVILDGAVVGHVGMVHPAVGGELPSPAAYLELELEPLVAAVEHVPLYREPSAYPTSSRDVTWIVPDGRSGGPVVLAAEVEEAMLPAAGPLLVGLKLVDLYRPATGDPKLTWRLTFQHADRTLRREEVEQAMQAVADAVAAQLGLARG